MDALQSVDWLAVAAPLTLAVARGGRAARGRLRRAAPVAADGTGAGHPHGPRGARRRRVRREPARRGAQHVLRGEAAAGPGALLVHRRAGHAGVLGDHAVRHGGGGPAGDRCGARRPHAAGGVELPAAVLGHRRADHRGVARPGDAGRRAGGGVAAGVRAGRAAAR